MQPNRKDPTKGSTAFVVLCGERQNSVIFESSVECSADKGRCYKFPLPFIKFIGIDNAYLVLQNFYLVRKSCILKFVGFNEFRDFGSLIHLD